MRLPILLLLCLTGFCRSGYSQSALKISDKALLMPEFTLPLTYAATGQLRGSHPAPEQAQQLLALYLISNGDTASIPVTLDYSRQGNNLTAKCLYPLGYNTTFLCRWRSNTQAAWQNGTYSTPPQPKAAPASVTHIYPGADSLPANILLFYVRFSSRMQPDEQAWRKIHIRADTTGSKEIDYAWRQRSFWIDSGRVLVLMIHPGRVKHGIHYAGPLLYPGYHYRIDIDSTLKDIAGQAITASATKRFFVLPEDKESPEIIAVQASATAAGRQPIRVQCSEPMDLAGIMEGISLLDSRGHSQAVQVVQADRNGLQFDLIPEQAWKAGSYKVLCNARVTDLAANTLFRLFEFTDIREQQKDALKKTYSFRVKPAAVVKPVTRHPAKTIK